jgi:protein phosphatase
VPNFFERLFGKKEKKDQASPLPSPPEVRDPDATVPLPQLPVAPPPDAPALAREYPKRMLLGVAQDVGRVRDHNEDVLLAFTGELAGLEAMPNLGLFVVADGMGGHSLGERASGIAARALARSVLDQILPSLLADPHADTERPLLKDVMENAMTAANAAVVNSVPEGGTTLTCALVIGEQVVLSHVGDSRAYIITQDTFEQVTRDHSLVRRLQELGQITADEAAVHPQRSVLYRAVGQGEGLEVDTLSRRLPPGAALLLCSDGLWGLVPDHKILEVVRSAPTPQVACDELVAAANAAGGPDNITAIMVQLPG